jgi:hypothetical protein
MREESCSERENPTGIETRSMANCLPPMWIMLQRTRKPDRD